VRRLLLLLLLLAAARHHLRRLLLLLLRATACVPRCVGCCCCMSVTPAVVWGCGTPGLRQRLAARAACCFRRMDTDLQVFV
jgi:hypothetical protein